MPIYRFDPQKPGKPEAELFSNIDLSEPFAARIWGLLDILKLTNYKNKKEINDAIFSVLTECLLPAHISLVNIRNHQTPPILPELDRQKDYYDLHNHLWAAYKDRMPLVFKNSKFDVGFIFQKDANFETGLKKLKKDFPILTDDFCRTVAEDRNTWQKDMAMIRNDYIQHKKIESEVAEIFFTLENSEIIFQNIWLAIEQIILNFLVLEFPSSLKIIEIPKSQRDPTMPKKYQIAI